MKTTKISPTRILLEFPTKKELTLSMFRISEYFESDSDLIRGRKFTMDEFIDAYSDEDGELKKLPGGYTYFAFWDGYNVPKIEYNNFLKLYTNELSQRELVILDAVKDLPDNGYIIACEEGDDLTLKHETSHGIFFENEEYRNQAIEIVKSIPGEVQESFIQDLVEMGYNQDVMVDEMHAYLVAYDPEEQEECFPSLKEEMIAEYRDKLQSLFTEYNK